MQNGKCKTHSISLESSYRSGRTRVWKTDIGDEKERANSFSLTAGAVLGRRPVAKVGHTDAKCTWFTCENGQLTGVIGTRARRDTVATQRDAKSRGNGQSRVVQRGYVWSTTAPRYNAVRAEFQVDAREGNERGTTVNFFAASLCGEGRERCKNNGGGLDARGDGIRERNERYATIKPECRGALRPRETPKFSSIFLSQEGRVGAEDAFAIPCTVPLWRRAL